MRLSRIHTQWTMVHEAHRADSLSNREARAALIERYVAAAFRYLLGATRDPQIAEEVCQEFALRFARGDFHKADPKKGRFRNYLKTAMINLMRDYYRKRQAQPQQLGDEAAEPAVGLDDDDASFDASLREELLHRTWTSLQRANTNYHAVLLARVQFPDLTSQGLAEKLQQQLGRECSAAWVRKTLERAQRKFADLLVAEVRNSLPEDGPGLQEELQELDLLRYCKSALDG